MFIEKLISTLDNHKIKYGLVGGYAVVLHGIQRGTADIDFVTSLNEKSLIQLEKALNSIGLQSRLPVTAKDIANFRVEYIKNRNLIAWSFVNPKNPLEIVDVLITHDQSEFEMVKMSYGRLKISVISLDDLIRLKKEAGRAQDVEDVKRLQILKKSKAKNET